MSRLFACLLALAPVLGSGGAPGPTSERFYVPPDLSPQTTAALEHFDAVQARQVVPRKPATLAEYDAENARMTAALKPFSDAVVLKLKAGVTDDTLGGVPVIRIKPANFDPALAPLVYMHGGGWVVFSARSTAMLPALVGAATHREVISIDYTLAPRANFAQVTNQVAAVWRALLAKGFAPSAMALFGDSAGGNLALTATLKIRDQGLPLPGAIYAISPATDLTLSGETVHTLGPQDPGLSVVRLPWLMEVYVGAGDYHNPYASPLYGDYSKPFPPTLIQGGTRELLLSDFVREYQAIRGGGHEVVLDLYEGMPHVFQAVLVGTPESRTAISRAAAFLESHLTRPAPR